SAGGDPTLFLTFQDNICGYGNYGVCGTGSGCGNGTINTYFPGSTFSHNVLIGTPGGPNGNPASYPPDHWFPAGVTPVGFADAANNDYALLPTSPYYGAGSDGTDIGADIDSLNMYTAHVLSGQWPACSDFPTSMNGPESTAAFTLFPNPATGVVTVRSSTASANSRILVSDATGRVILDRPIRGPETAIDLTDVRSSVVIIRLVSGDGRTIGVGRSILQQL
ncbi:MAG: T9SS type A sorting domain-containing protein, partial [Flavobacteriales bacterium]|nr:T9SS type A sorting domain-containing protein [Flavobacteriales bacterium]